MPTPQLFPLLLAVVLAPCPAPVKAQLDGLYRWQLDRQERRHPIDITSQRSRFSAELYQQLRRAYALSPASGRYVDFDPFSGTQVSTWGAKVQGCTARSDGGLDALVAVQAGLRNRSAEPPQLLTFRLVSGPSDSWRIADITYSNPPGFRLSSYLGELLESRR